MPKRSDDKQEAWDSLRAGVLGLGERSLRKSYYAGLQERLRELDRFRALVDAGADVLLLVRCADGQISDVSGAAARLLQRPYAALIGQPARGFFSATDGEAIDRALASPNGLTATFDSELLAHQEAPIPVALSISRLDLSEEGGMALIAARDLRERLREEAERRALEQQALDGQRLESLGRLTGRIAHDFNNLIQVIYQHTGMAQLELDAAAPVHEDLTQIMAAVQVLRGLTSELTAYAGRGERRRADIDLSTLTRQMTELLKSAIARRARLSVMVDEQLPAINADASQLRQILLNLVVNSAEAAPRDRIVDIEVRTGLMDVQQRLAGPPRPGSAQYGSISTSHAALLSVRDTGEGIAPENVRQIFEPYFTTKPEGKGFGLATVLGIVRAHDGAISVESQVGAGTCFEILLPCSP